MFFKFETDVSAIPLPDRFTFPFYYSPHPIAELAAKELQDYLKQQSDFDHNFGLDPSHKGLVIGKMFGVLVVRDLAGDLGYLRAFSGKLADSNHHYGFVPPVFDMLEEDGFYKREESTLNQLNIDIKKLENDSEYLEAIDHLEALKQKAEISIKEERKRLKQGKKERKILREKAALEYEANDADYHDYLETLSKESVQSNYRLRDAIKYWKNRVFEAQKLVQELTTPIQNLKKERKQRSSGLQNRLFSSYTFLNQKGQEKSISEIFKHSNPPAGAGECAAPKLLQYAFLYNYQPIALAEFWWGASPDSEIRKSGNYYPACQSKCKPILSHMLSATKTDPNPLLFSTEENIHIETVFEDNAIIIINKPADLLSVPGKNIKDSVLTRMKDLYPDASGPMVVHRLDMSTSGLMVVTKNLEAYRKIQRQFAERTVYKRYVAILDGHLDHNEGVIELPLRVDLDDRPRQLVCYEHGRHALTSWLKVSQSDGNTRVHFFPKTGRTHQLRVHAAHHLGLNAPIKGDDLYGHKADRLHLHAEELAFMHPFNGQRITFYKKAPF
ncbi:RluA family pseudouridine synthase [Portibacter marinus]|uniref:RluA family pseudouridine synthase n=1 Tax=Portibacter marinus TaxID=2898660 RepID=UPI001F27B252|nr:RluA family pseudouridine synthase [Portibacter marinus]